MSKDLSLYKVGKNSVVSIDGWNQEDSVLLPVPCNETIDIKID